MSFSDPSKPPAGGVLQRCWPVSASGDLRHVRAGLIEILLQQRLPADRALDAVPDKVSAVASELAGNALRHGELPAQVCFYRCQAAFLIEVTDNDTQRPPKVGMDPRAAAFGLRIVSNLADAAGWYVTETGKHVWAHFTMPDRRSATR